MFSTTTIASSTTNPTEITIATRVRLFRLKPITYIRAKLAISDTHSTAETIRVAESWRRNSAITATTSRSEEHTSELQSLMRNSYAVFCLKKKKRNKNKH